MCSFRPVLWGFCDVLLLLVQAFLASRIAHRQDVLRYITLSVYAIGFHTSCILTYHAGIVHTHGCVSAHEPHNIFRPLIVDSSDKRMGALVCVAYVTSGDTKRSPSRSLSLYPRKEWVIMKKKKPEIFCGCSTVTITDYQRNIVTNLPKISMASHFDCIFCVWAFVYNQSNLPP